MAVKSETERGPWGAWARRERLGREWTVEEVVERVQREANVRMDVATLRGIEGGSKKPSVRLQDGLALVFGSRPQGSAQPVLDANAAILAALTEQTQLLAKLWPAVTELTQELRAGRAEQLGRDDTLVKILARLEAAVTPASTAAEDAPLLDAATRRRQLP